MDSADKDREEDAKSKGATAVVMKPLGMLDEGRLLVTNLSPHGLKDGKKAPVKLSS